MNTTRRQSDRISGYLLEHWPKSWVWRVKAGTLKPTEKTCGLEFLVRWMPRYQRRSLLGTLMRRGAWSEASSGCWQCLRNPVWVTDVERGHQEERCWKDSGKAEGTGRQRFDRKMSLIDSFFEYLVSSWWHWVGRWQPLEGRVWLVETGHWKRVSKFWGLSLTVGAMWPVSSLSRHMRCYPFNSQAETNQAH